LDQRRVHARWPSRLVRLNWGVTVWMRGLDVCVSIPHLLDVAWRANPASASHSRTHSRNHGVTALSGLALIGLAVVSRACHAALPQPAAFEGPQRDLQRVPSRPPPALLEIVPPAPAAGAVWVDGAWHYDGSHWLFDRGGWALVPPGYRLTPSVLVYAPDGSLLYAQPLWVGPDGQRAAPPTLIRAAAVPSAPETRAAGTPR
jgi:hypothetical protein